MRYLGLDLGTKTLGLSISDKTNQISTPLKTLYFPENCYEKSLPDLKEIIDKYQITDLVLGLPKNMDNTLGFASKRSLDYAELLKQHIHLPIHLIDERLSTIEAQRILISSDFNRKKRKGKIDNVASAIILDTYLRKKENDGKRN